MANAGGMGCKKLAWREHSVSLLCFVDGEDQIIHLFMLDASAIPDADKESLGIMAELYDRETVGWIADDIAYLLVGSKPGVVVGPYAPGADLRVALHRLRSRT